MFSNKKKELTPEEFDKMARFYNEGLEDIEKRKEENDEKYDNMSKDAYFEETSKEYDEMIEKLKENGARVDTFNEEDSNILDGYNDIEKVIDLKEKVYKEYCKNYGENDKTAIYVLNDLGLTYLKNDNYEKALECINQAYILSSNLNDDDNSLTYSILNSLAEIHNKLGNSNKYIECLNKLYEMFLEEFGPKDINTLNVLSDLGIAYKENKDNKIR